jgi:hypothetical protein
MNFVNAITFSQGGLALTKRLWSGWLAGLIGLISLVGYPLLAWADQSPPADGPSPVLVRTSLEPENPVVGQQVEFRVDVFVDTWFRKAPEFPEVQVEDAIALLPPSASINLNQRIDGKSYAGQRRTYFLFPQLPGRYEVPALSIQVVPAQPGSSAPEPITQSTEPIDFMASLPPELAAQGDDLILAIPQLRVKNQLVTQANDHVTPLKKLHTGDTVEQTVTLIAADTLASVLPAIAVPTIPGLSAYPDPPKLTNQFERGQFTASRTDHTSYVAEKPGRYHLPPQTITWWNTRTQSLQTEVIPAIDIRVQPTLQQQLKQRLPWLAGLLAVVGGLVSLREPLQTRWQTYRHQQQTSEPAQWRRLYQACQDHDPAVIWIQLMLWLASTRRAETVTLESFLENVDNPNLTHQVRGLEVALYGPDNRRPFPSNWSGQSFYRALRQHRKPWLQAQSKTQAQATPALPRLNPTLPLHNPH